MRLQTARQALIDAGPADGHSVSAIARDAGFGHLPRFARACHDAFGELPSTTLRR